MTPLKQEQIQADQYQKTRKIVDAGLKPDFQKGRYRHGLNRLLKNSFREAERASAAKSRCSKQATYRSAEALRHPKSGVSPSFSAV
jgi:hypothetical protein